MKKIGSFTLYRKTCAYENCLLQLWNEFVLVTRNVSISSAPPKIQELVQQWRCVMQDMAHHLFSREYLERFSVVFIMLLPQGEIHWGEVAYNSSSALYCNPLILFYPLRFQFLVEIVTGVCKIYSCPIQCTIPVFINVFVCYLKFYFWLYVTGWRKVASWQIAAFRPKSLMKHWILILAVQMFWTRLLWK